MHHVPGPKSWVFIVIIFASVACSPPLDYDAIKALPIVNLSHPDQNVFAGGQPTQTEFQALANFGVKHIVNLRPAAEQDWDEGEFVRTLGMQYHSIPVAGASGITRENGALLAAALQKIGSAPVLVHCSSSNRVGALIAVHESFANGTDIEAAILEGRRWGLTRLEPLVRELLADAVSR